jgi:hypothetical protein
MQTLMRIHLARVIAVAVEELKGTSPSRRVIVI